MGGDQRQEYSQENISEKRGKEKRDKCEDRKYY
jgi:hypothetical protein